MVPRKVQVSRLRHTLVHLFMLCTIFWYLLNQKAAKAQVSLRLCADTPRIHEVWM